MVPPPANIVGGSSVPFGSPVVPDVYSRFGRGTTSSGGSAGSPCDSHSSQSTMPGAPSHAQPTMIGRTPPPAAI